MSSPSDLRATVTVSQKYVKSIVSYPCLTSLSLSLVWRHWASALCDVTESHLCVTSLSLNLVWRHRVIFVWRHWASALCNGTESHFCLTSLSLSLVWRHRDSSLCDVTESQICVTSLRPIITSLHFVSLSILGNAFETSMSNLSTAVCY